MNLDFAKCNKSLETYLKTNEASFRHTKYNDYTIVLVPNVFAAQLGVRTTAANGWEPFDYDPLTKTIIFYHHKSRSDDNILWTLNKLVAHFDNFLSETSQNLHEGKYPKGIPHIPGSNSRVICIGNLYTYKFYYESNKDLSANLTIEQFNEI